MTTPASPRRAGLVMLALGLALPLGGCDPRDCALDVVHHDCFPEGSPLAVFPQDDAICRSYGLDPGSRGYAACRQEKRHVRQLTGRETDYGVAEEPLLPESRPVYQVR